MRVRLGSRETELVNAYRAVDKGAGRHARLRAMTCPFDRVAETIPDRGSILDLGCGHGLFSLLLAEGHPDRRVTGVDHDERKLSVAGAVAARVGADVRFLDGGDDIPAPGTWDAIVIVDVLYLLGRPRARDVLRAAAGALRQGGVLVVKEISDTPRWKHLAAVAQERLATGLLGITRGVGVAFLDPDDIVSQMRDTDLTVTTEAIDRWYPHPHHLFVGRRAAPSKTP